MNLTAQQINAWLLDPSRTIEELVTIIGVCKGQLDAGTFSAKVADAFKAGSAQADLTEAKRFG